MTKHYKQHLMTSRQTAWGLLAHGIGTMAAQWFLINASDEVAKLPFWLFLFICDKHAETGHFGPYIFYNNFELTAEAKYLKEMFQYPQLTPTASMKVQNIISTYTPCIGIDNEFVQALQAREAQL